MRRTLQTNKGMSLLSVIPKEIVIDLGLKAGDKLDFSHDGKIITAVPIKEQRK